MAKLDKGEISSYREYYSLAKSRSNEMALAVSKCKRTLEAIE